MTTMQNNKTLLAIGLLILYSLSGLVALSYEVLWMRMLSLQFGVSNFGVVITVGAFMLGLGLGSIVGRRYLLSFSKPLLIFALVEVAVAFYALSLPAINSYWSQLLVSSVGDSSLAAWHSVEVIAALFFMLVPATAMGLGFPLILAAIKDTSLSVAHVYTANTLGAALGALLPVLLLPAIGWVNSLYSIAAIGMALGVLFFVLSLLLPTANVKVATQLARPTTIDLLSYALIGMAALILQVAWVRLYGMALLRTEYVLAVILAVFLTGTAMGSALSQWGQRRLWLTLLPLVAALAAVISLLSLASVSAWAETLQYSSLINVLLKQGAALALVTITVTFCLGAWLPLLVRGYSDAATAGAWLYGANAIGAGVGALLAGFVLMPLIGTPMTVLVAALLLFVVGMRWCAVRSVWWAMPILIGSFFIVPGLHLLPPAVDLLPQAHANSRATLFLHEDAIAITHVVETNDGQRLLLSDLQRMDASTEPTAVVAQQNQARLPLLLKPSAEKILFLGLGTGISASAALDFDVEITAVELSQGAIESADKWFRPVNRDVIDKTNIVHDDARRYLMRSSENYDLIIGDLFHPDLIGRSRLLSLQQFERAKLRLNDGGLYVQWLALNQFDLTALHIVLNSFQQSFPQASLFIDGFRLAMIGSKDGAVSASDMLVNINALDQAPEKTGGEGVWTWLGRYYGRIDSPSMLIEDEWRPRIEYHLPRVRYAGEIDLQKIIAWLIEQRPSPQQAAQELDITARLTTLADQQNFERAYLSADASMRSWQAQLSGDDNRAQRLLQFSYRGNPHDQWVSGTLADRMLASLLGNAVNASVEQENLQRILAIKPDHLPTLAALLHLARDNEDDEASKKYIGQLHEVSPLYNVAPLPGAR